VWSCQRTSHNVYVAPANVKMQSRLSLCRLHASVGLLSAAGANEFRVVTFRQFRSNQTIAPDGIKG
jgi:hypothetical protein